MSHARRRVALVTLGCGRNEVDSDELAGRLAADGWDLVAEAADADVAVVNTCGFVEAAKKDSIDTVLALSDLKGDREDGGTTAVVAVGCLAERYGRTLAESLPEADAVLGFDDYQDISARLQSVLAGEPHVPHVPQDRRRLLPVTPVDRAATLDAPPVPRVRTTDGPVAALKLASGCDRRCSFCAIPTFRGSFVSRRPPDVLAEARWLAQDGVRELVLVSENSTSYGKDLGDLRLLEALLPELAAVDGVSRVRVSYLQPAEMRPSLLEVIASTPGVAPYFDMSFQHSSAAVLRRMRRFGDTERFLDLVERIRAAAPEAGIRSNVIVAFPGETEDDLAELETFLTAARLDAVGVFGYSDEDGTEAVGLDGHHDDDVVRERVERVSRLADELVAQRAEDRSGEALEVLVESLDRAGGVAEGRAAHQAPEVDGTTTVRGLDVLARPPRVGDLVRAKVVGSDGADLHAEALA
ncbi:MAG TPA: 30S ribosomal protein S12 methylthiotransferase RimO [Actinomycetes bacterium]|nr:30S ribosomal protein S12 methylthiotransferase RimO [Actinomycetes bacterium]